MPNVLTNGVFDIFHVDHVRLFTKCRELAAGGRVIVALDSDANVRRLKGPTRPVNSWAARREVLLALRDVDEVVGFDCEDTLLAIIADLRPDYLVKGQQPRVPNVVKERLLATWGGRLSYFTSQEETSTTAILERV